MYLFVHHFPDQLSYCTFNAKRAEVAQWSMSKQQLTGTCDKGMQRVAAESTRTMIQRCSRRFPCVATTEWRHPLSPTCLPSSGASYLSRLLVICILYLRYFHMVRRRGPGIHNMGNLDSAVSHPNEYAYAGNQCCETPYNPWCSV
jgi:hypothetical protein